ncbi:hypothetical protein ACFV4X_26365 [Streptomyces ardesiacus]|uniref:hypothetical protein n=1 Tax=Streptomyces ardesiacus TaxID=285564 RepID=UPI00365FF9C2
MTALILGSASWGVIVCAVACGITGRVPTALGLFAVAYAIGAVGHMVNGSLVGASWDAGFAAVFAWLWWNRGGGDGTRRRLRRWARTFRGVRRTAPAGGAA